MDFLKDIPKLNCPMRLVFAVLAILLWVGILSGAQIFIHIVAIIMAVVAATGMCMAVKVFKGFCNK